MDEKRIISPEEVPNPELRAALTEACEKQYRGWLYGGGYTKANSRDEIADTLEEIEAERKRLMEKHEEYMRQAELERQQARFMSNPAMREITENLRRKHAPSGLICPSCGDRDHGNRMNGKPWCLKCNAPLMTAEKAEMWVEPPEKPKKGGYTFK